MIEQDRSFGCLATLIIKLPSIIGSKPRRPDSMHASSRARKGSCAMMIDAIAELAHALWCPSIGHHPTYRIVMRSI